MMAHLDKLDITNRMIPEPQRRKEIDTVEYRRKKLIANAQEQIELAQLALSNRPLQLERKRGHTMSTVRPRLWWKRHPDGTLLTQVRYNKLALNLAGRGSTIEVKSLTDLPRVLRTVIKAIEAGELDQAIANAAEMSKP